MRAKRLKWCLVLDDVPTTWFASNVEALVEAIRVLTCKEAVKVVIKRIGDTSESNWKSEEGLGEEGLGEV